MPDLNELAQNLPWVAHEGCTWEQVGPCVYCVEHRERLYQGRLPAERDPGRATNEAVCAAEGHDWGEDFGQGFYFLCSRCGFKEWTV